MSFLPQFIALLVQKVLFAKKPALLENGENRANRS